jgi:hypothetical protein
MLYNKQALCARYLHLLLYDEKINKKARRLLKFFIPENDGRY